MVEYTSPAFARRQLRLALRRAREAAGMTQGHVAEALDWSISKVNRIETGDVKVSGTDLKALLSLLGVNDAPTIGALEEHAKMSRRRGWWDEPFFRQHLTPAGRQVLEFESAAMTVRCYQPALVPGALQSEAYARVIMDAFANEMTLEARTARIQSRVRRQDAVFSRTNPPEYLVILDESVVMREIGGPAVMAEQLDHLLRYINQDRARVRIIPLREGAPFAVIGGFILFDLGEGVDEVMYQEFSMTDRVDEVLDHIRPFRVFFERMWSQSLSEAATRRLLRARVAAMLSSLDRL